MLTSERPLCGRLSLPESSPQREEGRPARASQRREAAALLVLGLLVAAKVETTQEIRLVLTANGEFGVCIFNLIIHSVVIGGGGGVATFPELQVKETNCTRVNGGSWRILRPAKPVVHVNDLCSKALQQMWCSGS